MRMFAYNNFERPKTQNSGTMEIHQDQNHAKISDKNDSLHKMILVSRLIYWLVSEW